MPAPKAKPSPHNEWDNLAARYGQAGLENVIAEFTKHSLLGLSDAGTAIILGVLVNVSRQAISATAALIIHGADPTAATLPVQIEIISSTKPDEPPSPL